MSRSTQADQDSPRPACGVDKQCSDTTWRRVPRRLVDATFSTCGNGTCFGDDDPDDDDLVVVGRGRGTNTMHRPGSQ